MHFIMREKIRDDNNEGFIQECKNESEGIQPIFIYSFVLDSESDTRAHTPLTHPQVIELFVNSSYDATLPMDGKELIVS